MGYASKPPTTVVNPLGRWPHHLARGRVSTPLAAALSAIAAFVQLAAGKVLKGRPFFADGSKPGIFCIALVAMAAMVLGKRQEKDKRGEGRALSWSQRLASHPLSAWVLENSCVAGISAVSCMTIPSPVHQNYLSAVRTIFLGSFLQVWGTIFSQSILCRYVYAHVPTFNDPNRPNPKLSVEETKSWKEFFKEFCQCNLYVDMFNSVALGSSITAMTKQQFTKAWLERGFDPLGFLLKFTISRLCVDVGFWVGHRILHHPKVYWLHKRHHEHKQPSLMTNYHFAPVDLWIEGVFPAVLGMIALDVLQMPLNRFELSLLGTYIVWHESGSHCGKPVPTVTYFPPLAPLYQLLLGPVDLGNVKHHDLHHQFFDCNYGITVWPDMLMGTRVSAADQQKLMDAKRQKSAPF